MYLVQECGPTSFVIKEDEPVAQGEGGQAGTEIAAGGGRRRPDKKYKVTIGSVVGCTCKARSMCPCIHQLFVLVKLLRVPAENPLVWQASLLDNEVEQILRGRFQATVSSRKKARANDAGKEEVEQKEVEEGDVCAICQEEMETSEGSDALTWCRQSCGQSVHAKCMKVVRPSHECSRPALA